MATKGKKDMKVTKADIKKYEDSSMDKKADKKGAMDMKKKEVAKKSKK